MYTLENKKSQVNDLGSCPKNAEKEQINPKQPEGGFNKDSRN